MVATLLVGVGRKPFIVHSKLLSTASEVMDRYVFSAFTKQDTDPSSLESSVTNPMGTAHTTSTASMPKFSRSSWRPSTPEEFQESSQDLAQRLWRRGSYNSADFTYSARSLSSSPMSLTRRWMPSRMVFVCSIASRSMFSFPSPWSEHNEIVGMEADPPLM